MMLPHWLRNLILGPRVDSNANKALNDELDALVDDMQADRREYRQKAGKVVRIDRRHGARRANTERRRSVNGDVC
jgi:hypothetical protein